MTEPITKILIANRGEIASRIIKTCKLMGITTVAIHSDADRNSKFVREADESVSIGGVSSQESYLNIQKIMDAAMKTCAQAIHPGYGFLAENAEFARVVQRAGIIFIGPSVDTIQKMGNKIQAKSIMKKAGVPILPGHSDENQDPSSLMKQAEKIGFPCMIKAVAGGGGKGLKLVLEKKDLGIAIESALRESKSFFNDDRLMIEKYINHARHIEVQIIGDKFGQVIHLFERECSLQRRHQKIIEESPAAHLSSSLKKKMYAAAIKAAKAVHYVGAGTVEFIVSDNNQFYFLEMNTRLQVEHTVTERITGLDLVRMQIEVAQGLPIAFKQNSIPCQGHAMEARIYAENSHRDFLPSSGKLLKLKLADSNEIRYDMGLDQGDEMSPYYDPLIGKVIAHAHDRNSCINTLSFALKNTVILGMETNLSFLNCLLNDPCHINGDFHTNFIENNLTRLLENDFSRSIETIHSALIASSLIHLHKSRLEHRLPLHENLFCFRNVPQWFSQRFICQEKIYTVHYKILSFENNHFHFNIDDHIYNTQIRAITSEWIDFTINPFHHKFEYCEDAKALHINAWLHDIKIIAFTEEMKSHSHHLEDSLSAPLPGKVLKICVSTGQTVKEGDTLMIIEAMKMEHSIKADCEGMIQNIFFDENDLVKLGDVVVEMKGTSKTLKESSCL